MKGVSVSPSVGETSKPDMDHHHQSSSSSSLSTNKVGCIPGIFFFFNRHNHRHSRKRLLFSGSKEKKKKKKSSSSTTTATMEATKASTISTSVDSTEQNIAANTLKRGGSPDVVRCATTEMRRSPTLPPEMRRLVDSSSTSTVESPRKSSTLVARLMGLDDVPVISPASAVEKRRKVLGALEKCDEDLNTLKQIIDAVRLVETRKFSATTAGPSDPVKESEAFSPASFKKNETSSPVSSINDVKRSPESKRAAGDHVEDGSIKTAAAAVRKSKSKIRSNRRNRTEMIGSGRSAAFLQRERMIGVPRQACNSVGRTRRKTRCSEEVDASVNEVWKDCVAAEMRWELGKVGAELEHRIFKDLVEELVKEVELCFSVNGGGGASRVWSRLPSDACRRRLVFW